MDKVIALSEAVVGVCKVLDGFDQAGDNARNNEFNSTMNLILNSAYLIMMKVGELIIRIWMTSMILP